MINSDDETDVTTIMPVTTIRMAIITRTIDLMTI